MKILFYILLFFNIWFQFFAFFFFIFLQRCLFWNLYFLFLNFVCSTILHEKFQKSCFFKKLWNFLENQLFSNENFSKIWSKFFCIFLQSKKRCKKKVGEKKWKKTKYKRKAKENFKFMRYKLNFGKMLIFLIIFKQMKRSHLFLNFMIQSSLWFFEKIKLWNSIKIEIFFCFYLFVNNEVFFFETFPFCIFKMLCLFQFLKWNFFYILERKNNNFKYIFIFLLLIYSIKNNYILYHFILFNKFSIT